MNPARKGRPEPPPELYEAIRALLRAYQGRDRERPCYFDLSITECTNLEQIVRNGPMTVNELARRLHVDKSNASRVARSLERKKYVRRGSHSRDGRAVELGATEAGVAIERRLRAAIVARQKASLRKYEPRVRSLLPRMLQDLASAVVRPETPVRKTKPGRKI